jgi:hypothetical protein
MSQNRRQSIRRIVLASGLAIDVVSLGASHLGQHELHVCPACASELVQPVGWSETADDKWELTLHCPNCDWLAEGLFDERQVYELEDRLEEGLVAMLSDLRRMTQANMAEEVDRFVVALNADLVLPEDF